MNLKNMSKIELTYIYLNILGSEDVDLHKELKIKDDKNTLQKLTLKISEIPNERINELKKYTSYDVLRECDKKDKDVYNPFIECIKYNNDIFFNKLRGKGKKINLTWRPICKDLLIESIKIYCTPYKKEYYLQDKKEDKLIYIGKDWEEYLENLYSMINDEYISLIPFSSIVRKIKKVRIYMKLTPNHDYILFNDCLLNMNTGEILNKNNITSENIPYSVVDHDYLNENIEVQEYIFKLFNRIDTDNMILSIIYGLFNKRLLQKRSAVFNIQKSNTGKTLIITPFTELELFNNVNSEMLNGSDKIGLFKQYYCVVFEEIQDTVINGSSFNTLIDNTTITVKKLYHEPVTVQKELKPVLFINGESMPNFKGRTQGSFNRFIFIPEYKEALTSNDYTYITKNAKIIGIELIRHVLKYMKIVGKDVIKENIQNATKTEKELINMKESKTDILFNYIKQEPEYSPFEKQYCVSETILTEIIEELQERKIITVNLFNEKSTMKRFIKKILIPNIDTDIEPNETIVKNIIKKNKNKTARLKYILQLTDKGQCIVTDLGYKLSSLTY